MLAKVLGGPHNGLTVDLETIIRCCTIQTFSTPEGLRVFVLMPPTKDDWQKVVDGEIDRDEIEGQPIPYFQVRTVSGIEFHFDHGSRLLTETIQNHMPLEDEADEGEVTGVYFKCLRGDSENLALAEPDSFALEDAKGRTWICYPVTREDVDKLTLLDHVADTMAADAALRKHGLSATGTELRVYFCRHWYELHHKLATEVDRD